MISNYLKIMGNKEEVKEIRNFLIGGPEEAKSGMYIDFRKIKKVPIELKKEDANINTRLAQRLLFGGHRNFPTTLEETHEAFKKLDIKIQEESILSALKYQKNLIKYGGENYFDWTYRNWGTIWTEEWEQKLLAENEILFYTRANDPGHMIGIVSEKFPDVKIQLETSGDDGVYYKVVFFNGKYEIIKKVVNPY